MYERDVSTPMGSTRKQKRSSLKSPVEGMNEKLALAEVRQNIDCVLCKANLLILQADRCWREKAHSWLSEAEREQLCRLMECQKLSLEACTHAAQNERLPLRVVVQVLFFEQLQLRTSIAGCLLVSDNLEGSRPLRSGIAMSSEAGGWTTAVRENQVLKVGMDNMRTRLLELEKECSNMRQEIEKLGRGKSSWTSRVPRRFSLKMKSHMCSAQEGSVSEQQKSMSTKLNKLQAKVSKQKKQLSVAT